MLLDGNSVDPYAIFSNNDYGDQEDMMCSFFSFLVSKCIIRYAPRYTGSDVYLFSNPGRAIMNDKIKRTAFIEEFEKFYDHSR